MYISISITPLSSLTTIPLNEVIASVVGSKAVESYGIVGMASRQQVRDGIAEI
jgi:uncharacterized alkaline shock family protein YloU